MNWSFPLSEGLETQNNPIYQLEILHVARKCIITIPVKCFFCTQKQHHCERNSTFMFHSLNLCALMVFCLRIKCISWSVSPLVSRLVGELQDRHSPSHYQTSHMGDDFTYCDIPRDRCFALFQFFLNAPKHHFHCAQAFTINSNNIDRVFPPDCAYFQMHSLTKDPLNADFSSSSKANFQSGWHLLP